MRKIPYSYYIAKMKRISTLDQDFKPNEMPNEVTSDFTSKTEVLSEKQGSEQEFSSITTKINSHNNEYKL